MGFMRIDEKDKKELLENFTRKRIYDYLSAHKIAHYNQIKRELKLKNGNAAYHLRVLEMRDIVGSKKRGNRRYFYIRKLLEGL